MADAVALQTTGPLYLPLEACCVAPEALAVPMGGGAGVPREYLNITAAGGGAAAASSLSQLVPAAPLVAAAARASVKANVLASAALTAANKAAAALESGVAAAAAAPGVYASAPAPSAATLAALGTAATAAAAVAHAQGSRSSRVARGAGFVVGAAASTHGINGLLLQAMARRPATADTPPPVAPAANANTGTDATESNASPAAFHAQNAANQSLTTIDNASYASVNPFLVAGGNKHKGAGSSSSAPQSRSPSKSPPRAKPERRGKSETRGQSKSLAVVGMGAKAALEAALGTGAVAAAGTGRRGSLVYAFPDFLARSLTPYDYVGTAASGVPALFPATAATSARAASAGITPSSAAASSKLQKLAWTRIEQAGGRSPAQDQMQALWSAATSTRTMRSDAFAPPSPNGIDGSAPAFSALSPSASIDDRAPLSSQNKSQSFLTRYARQSLIVSPAIVGAVVNAVRESMSLRQPPTSSASGPLSASASSRKLPQLHPLLAAARVGSYAVGIPPAVLFAAKRVFSLGYAFSETLYAQAAASSHPRRRLARQVSRWEEMSGNVPRWALSVTNDHRLKHLPSFAPVLGLGPGQMGFENPLAVAIGLVDPKQAGLGANAAIVVSTLARLLSGEGLMKSKSGSKRDAKRKKKEAEMEMTREENEGNDEDDNEGDEGDDDAEVDDDDGEQVVQVMEDDDDDDEAGFLEFQTPDVPLPLSREREKPSRRMTDVSEYGIGTPGSMDGLGPGSGSASGEASAEDRGQLLADLVEAVGECSAALTTDGVAAIVEADLRNRVQGDMASWMHRDVNLTPAATSLSLRKLKMNLALMSNPPPVAPSEQIGSTRADALAGSEYSEAETAPSSAADVVCEVEESLAGVAVPGARGKEHNLIAALSSKERLSLMRLQSMKAMAPSALAALSERIGSSKKVLSLTPKSRVSAILAAAQSTEQMIVHGDAFDLSLGVANLPNSAIVQSVSSIAQGLSSLQSIRGAEPLEHPSNQESGASPLLSSAAEHDCDVVSIDSEDVMPTAIPQLSERLERSLSTEARCLHPVRWHADTGYLRSDRIRYLQASFAGRPSDSRLAVKPPKVSSSPASPKSPVPAQVADSRDASMSSPRFGGLISRRFSTNLLKNSFALLQSPFKQQDTSLASGLLGDIVDSGKSVSDAFSLGALSPACRVAARSNVSRLYRFAVLAKEHLKSMGEEHTRWADWWERSLSNSNVTGASFFSASNHAGQQDPGLLWCIPLDSNANSARQSSRRVFRGHVPFGHALFQPGGMNTIVLDWQPLRKNGQCQHVDASGFHAMQTATGGLLDPAASMFLQRFPWAPQDAVMASRRSLGHCLSALREGLVPTPRQDVAPGMDDAVRSAVTLSALTSACPAPRGMDARALIQFISQSKLIAGPPSRAQRVAMLCLASEMIKKDPYGLDKEPVGYDTKALSILTSVAPSPASGFSLRTGAQGMLSLWSDLSKTHCFPSIVHLSPLDDKLHAHIARVHELAPHLLVGNAGNETSKTADAIKFPILAQKGASAVATASAAIVGAFGAGQIPAPSPRIALTSLPYISSDDDPLEQLLGFYQYHIVPVGAIIQTTEPPYAEPRLTLSSTSDKPVCQPRSLYIVLQGRVRFTTAPLVYDAHQNSSAKSRDTPGSDSNSTRAWKMLRNALVVSSAVRTTKTIRSRPNVTVEQQQGNTRVQKRSKLADVLQSNHSSTDLTARPLSSQGAGISPYGGAVSVMGMTVGPSAGEEPFSTSLSCQMETGTFTSHQQGISHWVEVNALAAPLVCGAQSLVLGHPNWSVASAAEPCVLLELRQSAFAKMCREFPSAAAGYVGLASLAYPHHFVSCIPGLAVVFADPMKYGPFQAERHQVMSSIMAITRTVLLSPGEVLFNEEDSGDCAYAVISGEVCISVSNPAGEHQPLAFMTRGTCVGEMALFFPGPRGSRATATSSTMLLRITHDSLRTVLATKPRIWRAVRRGARLRSSAQLIRLPVFAKLAGGEQNAHLLAPLSEFFQVEVISKEKRMIVLPPLKSSEYVHDNVHARDLYGPMNGAGLPIGGVGSKNAGWDVSHFTRQALSSADLRSLFLVFSGSARLVSPQQSDVGNHRLSSSSMSPPGRPVFTKQSSASHVLGMKHKLTDADMFRSGDWIGGSTLLTAHRFNPETTLEPIALDQDNDAVSLFKLDRQHVMALVMALPNGFKWLEEWAHSAAF
jgi:CRP-like cAMP-binding protein